MKHRAHYLGIIFLAAAVGCAAEGDIEESLVVDETDLGIAGTQTSDLGQLSFEVSQSKGDAWETVMEVNGMTLTLLYDTASGVGYFDGYVTDTSETTMLTADDRAQIEHLMYTLAPMGPDFPTAAHERLHHATAAWMMTTDSLGLTSVRGLKGYKSGEPPNTDWCNRLNSYQTTSHDCNRGNYWADGQTLDNSYISTHPDCGSSEGTNFHNGSSWVCQNLYSHNTNIEYAYGGCFGHFGPGCNWAYGTGYCSGSAHHDECVRSTDHVLTSFYCNDEIPGGCPNGCW